MLAHEVSDCSEMSSNALGAKGIPKHQQCLQEDERVPDADLLLASRNDPHEQLILNRIRMVLPFGSSKVGKLCQPGVGLQTGQILFHFTRREWSIPSSAAAPWRERLLT